MDSAMIIIYFVQRLETFVVGRIVLSQSKNLGEPYGRESPHLTRHRHHQPVMEICFERGQCKSTQNEKMAIRNSNYMLLRY